MKAYRYIVLLLFACVCALAQAQTDTIRYVHPSGSYTKDGKSWANPKNRVQDAINDLHEYLESNSLTSGSVYIAAGTYVPTESTESSGGSMLNTSFKIYGGIHIYGGFNPDTPEEKPEDRIMINGKKVSENWADQSGIGTTSAKEIASQWDLKYKTILTGDHSTSDVIFAFDSIRGRYNTTFPASSYHVVWFATNGKYTTSDDALKDHFKPLAHPASLDGCVITSGNASSRSTTIREHTAFGGGVYMVGNASLRACTIERCNATLRGGGIYMDGGGSAEFCYVHTCQSVGVGVVEGYGGGVCIDNEGSLGHSHITSCAARCGGGLLISHNNEEYPWDIRVANPVLSPDTLTSYYSPFATACVINNNTANAEGGGIYLEEGGTINHCTVTANCCSGPDVTYYGRRHGRSGGIFVRNCGLMFNSVFWGNRCDANNDIQFASVRQKTGSGMEIFAYHTAFMNHDITDWTGVKKEEVHSLDKRNMPVKGSSGKFPCFFNPTVVPSDWHYYDEPTGFYGAGVMMHIAPERYPGPRIWHLTSYSTLDQMGVQASDAMVDVSPWLRHSHTDYGVVSNPYEQVSTLGALVRQPDALRYALVPPQGVEGRRSSTPIPTLFIDPNRKGVFDESGAFVPQDYEGISWDVPIKDLGEAISYFRQYLVDDPEAESHHYYMPKLDANGDTVKTDGKPDSVRYDYVQILVKEGTLNTVGPGNYLDQNIRTAAVRVESHMRMYGGYPSSLTGTNTDVRNPRDYVSQITANITGVEGERGYANNSAHVIAIVNAEHSIIDGFTLSDANTHNVYLSHSAIAGGGVLINNATTPQAKRIDMTGNQLRNCVITNCTAPKGAAVYVNGEHPKGDGYICYAELKMVNCIIRNNTADFEDDEHHIDDHGIITANGRAYIEVEHCDVVKNVGYPFKADNKTTAESLPIICPHPEHGNHGFHGYIRVNNSIIFSNSDRALSHYSDFEEDGAKVMSVFPEGQDYVFGEYNMFDADLRLHEEDPLQPHGFFNPAFTITILEEFVPEIEGQTTFGASLKAPIPSEKHNQAIFTRTDYTEPTYPAFVNPSRNVGHSPNGDQPLFGGTVSYEPMSTNRCVNAAGSDYAAEENYDRTDNCIRNRGGAPDIGAIENQDLPAAGLVIYVTPDGAGKRDGSSWSNAVAGNTVYRLYGAPAAEGDSIDAASNARLINKSSGAPVLTTDNRYCGGYARKYEYPMFRDIRKGMSTSIERDVYIGGERDGEADTTSIGTPTNTTTTGNWYLNGTIPNDGSYDPTLALDPRYPYGEMSGASRGMFRAAGNISPIDESGSYTITIATQTAPGIVASGQLLLTNERTENYVSGLQYAVEKASMLNKTIHKDTVQVWVGAGKYSDYKGYVMRDSVSVYGGFPISKYSAPSMNERKALLSKVVAIPKSKENEDLDAEDYETILQISDVNPKKNNTTIEPTAIKFKDDSAAIKWQFNLWTYDSVCPTTTHYYKWMVDTTDVSTTYMRYPNMIYSGSNNVFNAKSPNYRHKTDKTGVSTEGGWSWAASEKYVYQNFGDQADGNKSWELVYANRTNNVDWNSFKFDDSRNVVDAVGNIIGTVNRGMELTGGMSKMSAWQTMKNVPAGKYKLSIDLAAFYRQTGNGHGYDVENENTGVTFYILASNGDTLAQQPIFVKNTTTPYKLRRYTFEFNQPVTGDLTVRLMSAPGTKTTDPAALNSDMPALADNLNRREVMMANVVLKFLDESTGRYEKDRDEETTMSFNSRKETKVTKDTNWKKLSRTTLRKRVLQMPDVTSTVYGNGLGSTVSSRGKIGDPLSHYERVIKEGRLSNVNTNGTTVNGRHQDPNYKEYDNAYWDGFTIRHGFIYDQHMAHGGGAGVQMFEGGHLVNCIVTDNFVGCYGAKGGGVFCDGSNSTIENCFILNNTLTKGSNSPQQGQLQGGGMFLYEGTCFNSLLANNYDYGPGGGLALCVGKFYNNTLAYNTSDNNVGGLRIASGAASSILLANTIIYGNTGLAIDMTDNSDYAPFLHCYIQSQTKITKTVITHAINAHAANNDGNYGIENVFYNNQAPNASTTPFASDVNGEGTYTGNAKTYNDFALRQVDGIKCINSGTEDFSASLEAALAVATVKAIPEAKRTVYRNAVRDVELPANDVVYAKRIQDCQVDIGAYEFNAAYSIKPDTTTHPGQAIFYASFASPGGDASARSPENAACLQKLQLVLDAAGRYKYNLMTQARYSSVAETPVSGSPDKSWTVEVWLEGDSVNSRTGDEYYAQYTPTRSTKHSVPNYRDNTLDYAFIIPHGVYLKGGFKPGFYTEEDGVYTDQRDPLTYRTVLSGNITSATGAKGQCYHVVAFTDDLFDGSEMQIDEGNQLAAFSALPDAEKHRAVLDGVFVEDGYANGPDIDDKVGAGCVVTDFAHVRNCVIMNNKSLEYGGGLYLKPNALVSGTIVKYNTADVGGGVYVESPSDELDEEVRNASLAHVFSSTICENTGIASAGGVFFDNTYARINSSAIWHNSANDNANIAGNFARSVDTIPYPLTNCAVESRRLEGQGNIELSPSETEGVRWDRQDPFDAILYYPIEMSSTLSRAGMSYTEWDNTRAIYMTLDSVDIAGVSRKRWLSDGTGKQRGFAWDTDTLVTKNNTVIEIGARALNRNFEVSVNSEYVMHRLYVVHSELINSVAARALQDNPATDSISNMYRQMGSCILNPFHRLDDAFSYVIKARMMNPEKYRNTRFEIFVEQGTYYPLHDAYGRQNEVRMNTFLIPEAVLIVGGIDSRQADHQYGQDGFKSPFSSVRMIGVENVDVPIGETGYTINFAYTDSIRLRDARHRPMRDNNLNSVIEPWELERQTILSGNAVSGEDFTHVYHVITCHADERYVGPRPLKYASMNPNYGKPGHESEQLLAEPLAEYEPEDWVNENDYSLLARTIGFDGVEITGGYANHVDINDTTEVYNIKTYFRGGGIFVDGDWHQMSGDNPPNMTEPAKHNIPIVVEHCIFTNNMAGNGGAIYSNGGIYSYGCHFTQNYSQGPMTDIDQRYIPWTAGGCIAMNAFCGLSNTLFDNNEARRGLYPIIAPSTDTIPNADARQGFGGVISAAPHSLLRVVNCHFVKNKAVAYSSIYNHLANNRYSNPDSMQFCFNTIFWGNEVFEVDNIGELDHIVAPSQEDIDAFNLKYKASRAGVFHYDGSVWERYERLYHQYDSTYHYWAALGDTFNIAVTDKLAELRAVGNQMEGLYFCAYRQGYGPTGMKPTADGFLLTEAEQRAWKDPRGKQIKTQINANNDRVEDYNGLWTHVRGNNNVLINRLNTATDGPNFKQPSFVAGIDGYMQNADWLLARMNLTTDQGWGTLKQTVERGVAYYITKYTGTDQFNTPEAALAAAQAAHPGATAEDVYPVSGLPVATFNDAQPDTAMYNFLSWRYGRMMSETNAPLPLKDQYYMTYTRTTSDSEMSGNMNRISRNPKMDETEVYIDMGVYEYQYVQLDIKGQEIDTVWVATKAKDPLKQDGLTWETPTTDMQAAIELLMSSHNNHDKYVCLMGDDDGRTFSPLNVLDNRRAFIISSNSTAPLMPDSAQADYDYGVNSLTFLGGYSYDVKDAQRDPLTYPTVVEMPNVGNPNQLNQLFVVEDMTRQMLQLNFQGEYVSRDSVVIPIVFDGITFINPYSVKEADESAFSSLGGTMSKKGGAAIYYRWQRRYEGDGSVNSSLTPNFNMALHPDSAKIDGRKVTLPKLTISNCIFMDNGKRTADHAERSPAIRIDHGGGSSLIVNTLFHSNAGAPIYARTYDILEEENDLAMVPNDVIIINSTSALNDGHIRLDSENSEVHNSLIWLDDLDNDTLVQLQMGASDQWDKTTNKDRQGIGGRMTNNAVWGCFQPFANALTGDSCFNHPLSTENNDISKGPGFLSPYVTATTSEQRRERSFRLNPSIRTMEMADTTLYKQKVFFRQYPDLDAGSPYWRRSNGFKEGSITTPRNDYDLAAKPRLSGKGMERGAYECLAVLQRVLYVRPELSSFAAGDGSSWDRAFGQGQLQNAIDAAAVYTYLNQNLSREDRKAYVFVKGTGDKTDHYHIEARDGVYVFGSVPGYFNDTAWIDTEQKKFTNEECHRYVNYVRAVTPGVASPNAPQTKINSVHITGDAFNTGFLLDGFVITNPNGTPGVEPLILLDNDKSTVRNCLIVDNHMANQPVADVQQGLLYNNLFYNDTAETIVKVGPNGLVLNNTIVANNADEIPIDASEATSGALQNNISLNRSSLANHRCFVPYLTSETPYELPAYLTNNPSLAFQLHEHSAFINAGTMDSDLPALFDDYKNDSIIKFKWDRDVLGNPRHISSSVDMGALETWYIAPNQTQEISAITNRIPYTSTNNLERDTAYTWNYGGHKYPHPGSVVYLMDSTALSMQYNNADFTDFRGQDIVLRPAYMLLKSGASFYGNGHKVQLSYLAAEKRFVDQRYSMTSFPFNYSVGNITSTSYDDETDALTINPSPLAFTTYQYNGAARSAKDYVLQPENSTLWTRIDTTNRTATEGYLMDFGASIDTVLRFTAFAPLANQYVYTETGETDRIVYLTQYDHRTAGTGQDLNFTRQEDMGWNMKGLPWLVTGYRTDTILEEGNYQRQMFIPHVLYQMNGAGEYETLGGGQIYSARSWDQGTTISMGNAFFTQTATTKDREAVYFHLPYYAKNDKVGRPLLRVRSASPNHTPFTDLLTVIPDSTVSKDVRYTFGRDAIKWASDEQTVQLYLLDSKRLSRISLLGAAPTEVDIPVGINVPITYNPSSGTDDFTFSLPEKEAFSDYGYVWLIDNELNRFTNLLEEDYTVSLAPGENNRRFALRIGGYPKTNNDGQRQYVVYAINGMLYVRGLIAGDRISIYTPLGQLVQQAVTSSTEWRTPLNMQSGFVVRVNDCPTKVVNW